VAYYNAGCWTERPCHCLAVRNGHIEVRAFEPADADEPALAASSGPVGMDTGQAAPEPGSAARPPRSRKRSSTA
jgi:hypothetical protein